MLIKNRFERNALTGILRQFNVPKSSKGAPAPESRRTDKHLLSVKSFRNRQIERDSQTNNEFDLKYLLSSSLNFFEGKIILLKCSGHKGLKRGV